MPELPEVETTVTSLKQKVLGRTFLNVWTDTPKLVRKPSFSQFKKEIKGEKIKNVRRKGKYILFELEGKILLVHQKMTGHLLYGSWEREKGEWASEKEAMGDKMNSYIHLLFFLDNGKMIALSNLRKFARIELWEKEEFKKKGPLSNLGPEPLSSSFTLKAFKKRFKRRSASIKTLLMDQTFIAGVGNIYANEILWKARVSPFKKADKLKEEEKKRIYRALRSVLEKAVKFKGTSISDYRTLKGEKGNFGFFLKVYQKEGEKCGRCGNEIKRKKIGGRSAYYCPHCQPL